MFVYYDYFTYICTMKKKYIDIEKIERFYRIEEDGNIFSLRKQRYLSPSFNTAGYKFVNLTTGEVGSGTLYSVHRIVATKYLGQCPENMETSHEDGNIMNNHYSNFKYRTHADNCLKSYREHGRVFPTYPRKAVEDSTKELMSNAKKKAVIYTLDGVSIRFPSIEEAAKGLNTYRRKIYLSIKFWSYIQWRIFNL
jgi:hypothetical protein